MIYAKKFHPVKKKNIFAIRKQSGRMTQRKRQLSAGILILVFAFYYANISFFYHSHTINGLTVSHSHFYGTNHINSGTHTASELSLISVLSTFQSLQTVPYAIGLALFLLLTAVCRTGPEEKPVSVLRGNSLLRAPPALY
jgi:hypothetical protein